ncbi:hypothetical protein [Brachybacterium sillae]|uniref:hypothetical protein n=1 Tax=Brachybacterium sillae TaxID=2810536 RepID=UPI00217ED664|nr:hypothetical protein [Brachybacterium sillae]
MPVPDLLLAEPRQVIDPPQYSVAWLVLTVLCLLLITATVLAVLRLTRRAVERRAYAARPDDDQTLKAEFLRAVNDVADRHRAGELTTREGHHELTAVMRSFVRRTTGQDVTTQDVRTLRADARTREVGELLAELAEPGYSPGRIRISTAPCAAPGR